MALCLAVSLIEKRGFDAKDQMDRYCRWHDQGYLSSNGRCFDIGNTVQNALSTYLRTSNPFSGSESPSTAGTDYVVESLEAALWAFDRSRSFREGALLAVNLGNDADTTGAIYGQLAGAFYGAEQIPPEWRTKLVMHNFIVETADQLVNLGFL
jgi:ADP-ribosylglycohydrolase